MTTRQNDAILTALWELGATDEQIATLMRLSPRTVKAYRRNLELTVNDFSGLRDPRTGSDIPRDEIMRRGRLIVAQQRRAV